MKIRFTKREGGNHGLTIIRDDGTVSQGGVVPGFGANAIPHDLLHVLVERELGFRRGVFGLVNTGLEISDLLKPESKRTYYQEVDLMYSEAITAALQQEPFLENIEDFSERLKWQFRESPHPAPTIAPQQVTRLRAEREAWTETWKKVAIGDTLEVDLSILN